MKYTVVKKLEKYANKVEITSHHFIIQFFTTKARHTLNHEPMDNKATISIYYCTFLSIQSSIKTSFKKNTQNDREMVK
jgi:hypothetical protein